MEEYIFSCLTIVYCPLLVSYYLRLNLMICTFYILFIIIYLNNRVCNYDCFHFLDLLYILCICVTLRKQRSDRLVQNLVMLHVKHFEYLNDYFMFSAGRSRA